MRFKDAGVGSQDIFEPVPLRSAVDIEPGLLSPVMVRRISQFVTTDNQNGHHQQQQKDDGTE